MSYIYKLEIKSLYDQNLKVLTADGANQWLKISSNTSIQTSISESDLYVLSDLCDNLCETKEFWIAYKIMKQITSLKDEATYHNHLGLILRNWVNFRITTDEISKAYQRAIELDPNEAVFRYNYGFAFLIQMNWNLL